jgi:hypothetical protein
VGSFRCGTTRGCGSRGGWWRGFQQRVQAPTRRAVSDPRATVPQLKAAIKEHNARYCLLVSGRKADLKARMVCVQLGALLVAKRVIQPQVAQREIFDDAADRLVRRARPGLCEGLQHALLFIFVFTLTQVMLLLWVMLLCDRAEWSAQTQKTKLFFATVHWTNSSCLFFTAAYPALTCCAHFTLGFCFRSSCASTVASVNMTACALGPDF